MAKKIVKEYTGPAMTMRKAFELTVQYEKCPKCGCDRIGGGMGTLEVDTEIGYFSCRDRSHATLWRCCVVVLRSS